MATILIIDDEESFLKSLKEGLCDSTEHCVITASTGKRAVKLLRSKPVDLVLTDLKMPEMGGYELIAHMAGNYPKIPVIVMTAFGTPEIEEHLCAIGVTGFIEKPLDLDDVIEKVSGALLKTESATFDSRLFELDCC